jgi:adenine-specific DNA-methyltransferase
LLADNGSIYVHLDWHVGHYAKAVLDEVFGIDGFRNEVVWKRGPQKSHGLGYGRNADKILFYTKSNQYTWNKQVGELSEEYLQSFKEDEKGKYVTTPLHSGKPAKHVPKWRGTLPPSGRGWAYKIETLEELDKDGLIEWSRQGVPRLKRYLGEIEGAALQEIWTDVKPLLAKTSEHVNYATQKPEALLERIIKASSNEDDLVMDSFVGSGTTARVAEKLNRRWIACDLSRFAIHVTRKRLLQIPNVKPFVLQNLGKYERQAWQASEFPDPQDRASQEKGYRHFILGLYHAEPVKGFVWLHGAKERRMVHVGAVDAPVALGDVKAIVQEFWKSVGKSSDIKTNGVDILGWEFAFDINETAKQQAAASKVDVKFKKIPREVLDKRAVEQGDVHFFELAGLDVKVKKQGKKTELALKDFVIPPDDVPEDVRTAITHWSQWIDYWAVDWNYRDDTFHNEWQTYRTKKNPKIELSTSHQYEEKGKYTIVVKVIDILGNDTTKAIRVEMG